MKLKPALRVPVRALLLLLLLASLTLCVFARGTTLTTHVPGTYTLRVELSGSGSIRVNGTLCAQTTALELAEASTPEVALTPGSRLQAVFFNGEDVTARFESGKLVLPALRSDCVLRVVFAPADTPATGDAAGRLLPVCLSAAALCLCCLALLGKKHRTI